MIKNLQAKLSGLEPVTREELFELVDSWGRKNDFSTDQQPTIKIKKCKPKECYDLSNLDVSQIDDMNEIFRFSDFNGDISKWNVSNVKNMNSMFSHSIFNGNLSNWDVSNVKTMRFIFYKSQFNNNSLNNWDISNVKYMNSMFDRSNFNGDISNWKFYKNVFCEDFVYNNDNFEEKYNNQNSIPNNTEDFLDWFEENRFKMREINTPKQEILDFFSFDSNNLNKEIN